MFTPLPTALYRNRRRSLARRLADGLTPWSTGLTVTAGMYVRTVDVHLNTIAAFVATTSGTTGVTKPTPSTLTAQSDGGVSWQLQDVKVLLTIAPPIPTPA